MADYRNVFDAVEFASNEFDRAMLEAAEWEVECNELLASYCHECCKRNDLPHIAGCPNA